MDINNLDNSEKNRILEMHKKHGYSLSEQETIAQKLARSKMSPSEKAAKEKQLKKAADDILNNTQVDGEGNKRIGMTKYDDDRRPDYLKFGIPKFIEIDGSLFKNGIANIDKTNTQYKEAIISLKKIPDDMSVNITGGASDVGTKQGFDNPKLAMLRATNFIKAAQSDGVKVKMVPFGKVGTNTVKNSPGAEAEQFVKIDFTEGGGFKHVSGRDNTAVNVKVGGRYSDDTEDFGSNKFKMCLGDLNATEYQELLKRFRNRVKSRSVQ